MTRRYIALTLLVVITGLLLAACSSTQASSAMEEPTNRSTLVPTLTPAEIAAQVWERFKERDPVSAAILEEQRAERERLNDPDKVWVILISWHDGTEDRYLAAGPVDLLNERTLRWTQVGGGIRTKYVVQDNSYLRYIDIVEYIEGVDGGS